MLSNGQPIICRFPERALIAVMLACVAVTSHAGESQWPTPGGDPGGQHHSSAAQITASNVGNLTVAWIHRSGDMADVPEAMDNISGQSTPILLPPDAGEHLVYCTPFNRIIALDPGTGAVRWEYDPELRRDSKRPYRCRGVTFWSVPGASTSAACTHRVYSVTADRRLIALDARTGRPCRDFGNNGVVSLIEHGKYTMEEVGSSSSPAVANGVVLVGSTVVDFAYAEAPPGLVAAYDAITGTHRWTFDPLEGVSGTGAANVWAPIAVDGQRDLAFVPTSSPSPDYYGVLRPGNNGYANSVVALRLASGEVAWSYQLTHHDLWDYDAPAEPMLFDWPGKHGEHIPALAQVTKQGFVFVLDRRDGTPLFEVEERPVPASTIAGERASPTQPFPLKPPPLLRQTLTPDDAWGLTFWDRGKCREKIAALKNEGLFTPIAEQATLLFPGSLGGANWGGGAYLDERHLFIVNVNTIPFIGQFIRSQSSKTTQDHAAVGGQTTYVTMQGTPYTVALQGLLSPFGIPCSAPPWGKLVAINLATGNIEWEAPLGSVHEMGPVTVPFHINWGTPNLGGGLVTDGGVFFIGATMDRMIRAFDASDGRPLWHYALPVDATASPMTYLFRGRQYVLINAGGHAMFSRGTGDYLYAFALPPPP